MGMDSHRVVMTPNMETPHHLPMDMYLIIAHVTRKWTKLVIYSIYFMEMGFDTDRCNWDTHISLVIYLQLRISSWYLWYSCWNSGVCGQQCDGWVRLNMGHIPSYTSNIRYFYSNILNMINYLGKLEYATNLNSSATKGDDSPYQPSSMVR